MQDINWSNQLSRLFNEPLDKHSVFETYNELKKYLDEVYVDNNGVQCYYPLSKNKYVGQIVAVKKYSDEDPTTRLYVLVKNNEKFEAKEIMHTINNNKIDDKFIPDIKEKINRDIMVSTPDEEIGSYSNGDIITAGTEIQSILEKILNKHDTYELPTFDIKYVNGEDFEAGIDYSGNSDDDDCRHLEIEFEINKNDSKGFKSLSLIGDSFGVKFAPGDLLDGQIIKDTIKFTSLKCGENNIEIKLSYDKAEEKYDYFTNEVIKEGMFEAGVITKTLTIYGRRKVYFAALRSNEVIDVNPNTNEDIGKQIMKLDGDYKITDGSIRNLSIPIGAKQILIAVPADESQYGPDGDKKPLVIKSIKAAKQASMEILDNFDIIENIKIIKHGELLTYNLYVYNTDSEFINEDKFVIVF